MFEFVVFDCLLSLRRGNELMKGGESALTLFLQGAPFAYVAFDYLQRNGLIWPVHDPDDAIERWVLSVRGYDYLCRMEQWYQAMPLWLRLLGRLGLAETWCRNFGRISGRASVWKELA